MEKSTQKSKTPLLVLAFMAALLIFTSCIETDIAVNINIGEEGGRVTTSFLMEQRVFDLMEFNEGELNNAEIERVMVDGSKYVKISGKTEYKTFGEMETAFRKLSFLNGQPAIFKEVNITKETSFFRNRYIFKAVINAQTGKAYGMDINDTYTFHTEIKMPGKIINCTGAAADKNILKLDIPDLSAETEKEAVSEQLNIVNIIFLAVTVIFVICFLILLLSFGTAPSKEQ